MYGRLVGLCTTLESSRSSSLAPFIVLRSIHDFLMNAIQYLFGWQLRFGLPPAVHRFLSHTVLLLLLSLYLPILLEFFLLPLLIVLSPFLFLSPLLLSCSFSCTFCSFLLFLSFFIYFYLLHQLARYFLYLSYLCNVVSVNIFYSILFCSLKPAFVIVMSRCHNSPK